MGIFLYEKSTYFFLFAQELPHGYGRAVQLSEKGTEAQNETTNHRGVHFRIQLFRIPDKKKQNTLFVLANEKV